MAHQHASYSSVEKFEQPLAGVQIRRDGRGPSLAALLGLRALGGVGSGYFDHAGRPGHVGGSAPALGGQGSGNFAHYGRPGRGGSIANPVAFYHGTSSAALPDIKAHGLVPKAGKGADVWAKTIGIRRIPTPQEMFAGERLVSVFIAHDPIDAGRYAQFAAEVNPGSTPVILKVEIPASELKRVKADSFSYQNRFVGTIPPEWIKGRLEYKSDQEFTNDPFNDEPVIRPLAQATETYYFVIFVPARGSRNLGGVGSGNFGHAGRPGEVGGSAPTIPSGILAAIQAADGGFTYNPLTGAEPTTGYALSLHKDREKILPAKSVDVVALAEYTVRNADLLSQPGNYLGGWHNPVDDQAYLDVSTIVQTAEEAERLGREAGQLAYFDLVKGQSVEIKHTGTGKLKAATQFGGAARWPAIFGRSYRARAALDGPGTDAGRDSFGPSDPRLLSSPELDLHRAADAQYRAFAVAVRFAMARARAVATKHPRNHDAIVAALHDALAKVLPPILRRLAVAGGELGATKVPQPRAAKKRETEKRRPFKYDRQAAIDWADQHAAELIDGISETTREDLNNATADALETGDWDQYRQDVLDAIGDEDRADLIAATEIMTAVNEGQRQSWQQAVEDGALDGDTQRTWVTMDDELVCPICGDLDGETIGLDEQYSDGSDGPPAHPRCRCVEVLA